MFSANYQRTVDCRSQCECGCGDFDCTHLKNAVCEDDNTQTEPYTDTLMTHQHQHQRRRQRRRQRVQKKSASEQSVQASKRASVQDSETASTNG